jgi:hypothetical protein
VDAPVFDQQVKLYPNPVSNEITLQKLTPGTLISIYKAAGEKVWNGIFSNETMQIDLRNFSAGLYLIRLQNGDQVYTDKFLKN